MRLLSHILTCSLLLYAFASAPPLFALDQVQTEKPMQRDHAIRKNHHDRVALIESGAEGAQLRLDLIEAAQQSIDISYYTITRGKFTDLFLASLLVAADRGVQIRILCDGLTAIVYERRELREALRAFETHPSIEVRYFEKVSLLRPSSWHHRLHDKLMLVDGKLALIGGRNIGDKYFMQKEYQKRYVNDRDTLLYHEGEGPTVIEAMQHYYDQLWEYEYTKPHRKTITDKQKQKGESTLLHLRSHYQQVAEEHPELFLPRCWKRRTSPCSATQFVHNPLKKKKSNPWCLEAMLTLASQARSSIVVQSPYIIPTARMKTLFKHYPIDMELVTILTNSNQSSPNPIAIAGYYNHREDIVDTVGRVYEYQGPDSIHAKSYIIDQKSSIVGTFNLDSRSSFINTESMLIIESEQFASELMLEIQGYMDNSAVVQDDYTYGGAATERKPLWLFSKFVGLFAYYL